MDREKKRKRDQRWRENNREKIRAQNKRWRTDNPEKHAASLQRWRKENPEKVQAQSARYYDRLKACTKSANDRAKRIGDPGRITPDDIRLIYRVQRDVCAQCKKDLNDGFVIDHKIPLSLDGSNEPKNIQLLCPDCDKIKTATENTKAARIRRIPIKVNR